jgi:hypothetical protein
VIRANPTAAEARQKMQSQLRAIEVECPLAPRTGGGLGLELCEPTRRDLGKGEARRERQLADRLQPSALPPCFADRSHVEGAEARAAGHHQTDGVLPIRLHVDAGLKTTPAVTATASGHGGTSCFSVRGMKDPAADYGEEPAPLLEGSLGDGKSGLVTIPG